MTGGFSKCGKLYFLVLVLFLLGCSLLYSDVVLTDQEYQTVMKELTISEEALVQQKTQITELEKLQEILSQVISLQEQELKLLKTSLQQQKNDQWIHDLKMFGLGFLTGNLTGLPIGVTLGIKL